MKEVSKNQALKTNLPIVGIGASAGGLEAFEQFFTACPADIGMAFVLVTHLDPNRRSLLSEILQRTTKMPVVEAVDQVAVKPNCIYIIPPNRDMEILQGKLQLSLPEKPHGHRMPIDLFFQSLAEDQLENAVGIVFSGTGSDGTLGLRAIFSGGGTTFVQEPTSAQFNGMPESAIQAGDVSQVLNVEKMPKALLARKHFNFEHHSESGIHQILLQIRKVTGHDFSRYKKTTICRRIERRMLQHGMSEANDYVDYIKKIPKEVQDLFKELLINVTRFFRDKEAFAALQNTILPSLFKDKPEGYVFRVWVAGCSTGEEAYSIAILLHEYLTENHQNLTVQIFSTDLDHDAIAIARAGVYAANLCQEIEPERLKRHFTKVETGYQIHKNIREMVVFAVQNVIKDPPFTKLDLISCRNLMIYLGADLQSQLMNTFYYALKPTGVLFLSPSESVGGNATLFTPLDRKWKLYAKKLGLNISGISMSSLINVTANTGEKLQVKEVMKEVIKEVDPLSLAELSRRVLVQCFAPASVMTDMLGNILYVHGETGKYLRPALGQASLNIIDMAREGLEMALRAAIHAATNENHATLNLEVKIKADEDFTLLSLSVRPIVANVGNPQNMLLISFVEGESETAKPKRKRTAKTVEIGRITELERDLCYLKENHQVMIEEQQAANEELKSTNEELQSTNEEMQSTNEELETSKEELQSVNEELITVNAELQTKIEMNNNMQNDLKNLLDSINIGIIFLDKYLNIRSFTREAVRIYRLVPSDVGRSLSDIKPVNVVVSDDLMVAAQQVLDSLIPHERELEIGSGTWVMVRIQPYRTLDNFIDGVVLTFTDITLRMQAAKDALVLATNIVNAVREPLMVLDGALKVVAVSRSFYVQFQVNPEHTIGQLIFELGNHQWDIPSLRTLLTEVLSKNINFEDYEVAHAFPNIGQSTMRLNARQIISEAHTSPLILLAMELVK